MGIEKKQYQQSDITLICTFIRLKSLCWIY